MRKSLYLIILLFTLSLGYIVNSEIVIASEVEQPFRVEQIPIDVFNTPIDLNVTTAVFNVTVPTSLPIDIDEYGNVFVSTSAEVKNNSTGPVSIKKVDVLVMNDWSLVPFNTDFRTKKVGMKLFGMNIQGSDVNLDGSIHTDWPDIPVGEKLRLNYSVVVATQPYNIINETIAEIVFTIDWGAGYNPIETPENTWDPEVVYYIGDEVIYNGSVFTPHWNSVKGKVPGLIDSPWQEITDEWRAFNIYPTSGIVVWHNGVKYMSVYYSKGLEPGTVSGDGMWFELIDEWRKFNIYFGGETVLHDGLKYRAKWYTHGEEPPADVWELIP